MKKKFEINIDIYSEDIINQTIGDFEEISEIKYTDNNLEIHGSSESEINEIFNEFMNYVIGLINE